MDESIFGYYQHQDGGIYLLCNVVTSATDLTEQAIYEHWWPFEYKVWTRPLSEFLDGRFKFLDIDVAVSMINSHNSEEERAAAQAAVTERRNARKATNR